MANLILNRGIVDNEEFLGEAIDFEPIDNSDVEIEEGNKLYIHPIDTENPKLKNITHIFNASIKDLERHIGNIPGNTKFEKAQNLINGVFHSGFDVQLYVSNRSFPRKDGSVNKRIAVRTPRVPGDWLDTNLKLPISKTIIFEGTPTKAKQVTLKLKGITAALAGMSGGKSLTIYYVAEKVRDRNVSCVMSFWNDDNINPKTKLPPLLEEIMELK